MDIYVRKRRRNPSGALFMTFFLGLAIGLSAGYAIFGGKGKVPGPPPAPLETAENVEPPVPPVSIEPPITPPPEMLIAEAEPPPEEPAPAAPAITEKDVLTSGDSVWPGRFLFVAVDGPPLDDATKALLTEVRPGGVVLRDGNLTDPEQTADLVAQIKSTTGRGGAIYNPPLIAVEQEGGETMNKLRLDTAPSAAALGRRRDAKEAEATGRAYAAAAVSRGIGILLAPVLNVAERNAKDAASAVSADCLFGTDQKRVADIGLAFANGVLSGGAIPVAKYYPGLGKPQKTAAGETYVLADGARHLAELMYPFSEAALQSVPGILVGHVAVPAIDRQNPNRPASVSPILVKTILREKFKFAGVILAEDVTSSAITASRPAEQAVVEALAAGCDAVLFLDPHADRIRAACASVQDALDKGAVTAGQLAESRRRLDAWQLRLAKIEPEAADAEVVSMPAAPPPITPEEPAVAPPPITPVAAEQPAAVANTGTLEAKPPETPKPQIVEPPPNTTKVTHEIERGDTLASIAAQYHVSVQDLMTWNDLTETKIKYGLRLVVYTPTDQDESESSLASEATVPARTKTHVVVKGENIHKIAAKYGTTAKRLLKLNQLDSPNKVIVGQELIVPDVPATP